MRNAWMVTCALAALLGMVLTAACEDVGPAAADAAVTPGGGQDATAAPPDGGGVTCVPVKVDLLWVVDNSVSMCQEQSGLADGFAGFIEQLGLYGHIDLRTAVTTTTVLAESVRGRFNDGWATEYPPVCQAERLFPAQSDLHCECAACAGFDAAYSWQLCQDRPDDPRCGTPPDEPATYTECLAGGACAGNDLARLWLWAPPVGGTANTYNANGSVNTTCQLACGEGAATVEQARSQGAERCREWFGDARYECQVPFLEAPSGCIVPPQTADCPVGLPTVLPAGAADEADAWGLEWFRCLATVGTEPRTPANLESGLAAAWLALAEEGPAPTQVCEPDDPALTDETLGPAAQRAQCERRFLREDAWLVLAFVSDEDDCSVAEGRRIVAEDYNRCALLGDDETEPRSPQSASTDDRPLATVTSFVERFRTLRPDPQRVIVAAFAGDVWDPDHTLSEAALAAERERYVTSKTDPANRMALNTSIAAGPNGRADLGARYLRLVAAFGDRGFFHNIVGDLPAELAAFADELGGLVSTCE